MKTKLLFCFIFLLSFCYTFAQNIQIKGEIVDKEASSNLINASVAILQARDSILVKFTRVASDGSFKFNNMPIGDYILLVTYPDYADYVESFKLNETITTKDFGKIGLLSKARLLNEVIVKGEAISMKVNGDTTEFNAGSFKVQPNAKVEDLLKQLPGISIDKDGKITAQGQAVNRILVDGEEFFGDDPTLVTKNIRSDMVDKIQLYDDKSENAKFTGIDDGQISKTINLKLKEDKKKGYFGKLDAGGGNDDFYSTQGLLNFFNNKKKFSVYSTNGNTRRTGLDWQSSQKLGLMNSQIEMGDDGGISIFFGGDEFGSQDFYGEGIPEITNSGVHFENKWKEDKHGINIDLKYGRLNNVGNKFDDLQYNLPNSFQNNNSRLGFDNILNQKKINVGYTLKIDTSSNLNVSFDNTIKNTNNVNNTTTSSFSNNIQLINDGNRDFSTIGQDHKLNTSIFYGKKFKKPGRTLTFRFNQSYFDTNSEGILQATNNFYNPNGGIDSVEIVNQSKLNNQLGESYKTSLTVSEKLSKTISMSTNYDFGFNKVNSDLLSFNANSLGEYVDLDIRFSNNLDYNSNTHQGGLSFNYKKEKTSLTLGSKAAFAHLEQFNRFNSSTFERDFVNFIPSVNYTYSFTKQKTLRLNYNGSTQQPTVNQLQPVLSNDNPLFLIVGNPELGIAFTNRFNFDYYSYKVLTSRRLGLYGNYAYTIDPIVSNVNTDEAGKSISSFVNLENRKASSFFISSYFGGKFDKSKINWSLNLRANGNISYNLINNQLNQSDSYRISPSFSISKFEDKFSFSLALTPGYQVNKASLQELQNSNGNIFSSYGEFSYTLPNKVRLEFEYEYEFQEKTAAFNQSFNRLIINSSLSKTFLKANNLKFSLSGNDLFNQNVGFRRTAFGNTISQSSFTNIQRYFLFSIVWDFSKFGSLKASN